MVDVGGTRSERRKWVHFGYDAAVILFLVDISSYDLSLYEEESVNRMQESLAIFDSICKSRRLAKTSIVLFFTKIDCLETKLATSPFNEYFPEFSGDSTSLEDVKDYIRMRFLIMDHEHSTRKIDVYFTGLVSEISPGRTTIAAIEKILDMREREKRLIRKTHFIQSMVGNSLS